MGAGTMGSGIAQVAATAGHSVVLCDITDAMTAQGQAGIKKSLERLAEKGTIKESAQDVLKRIEVSTDQQRFSSCELVIESVVEDLAIKQETFRRLETICTPSCTLATNTSSLSIASIASACKARER